MKKEHLNSVGCMGIGGFGTAATPRGAGKMVGGLDEETDAGMDELLAALGYKVRSSDMADVAQKLEQLEMAIGSSAAQDDALLAHLATDTVHYNPSDLSNWLESMLSELGSTPLPMQPVMHSNSGGYDMSPPPPMSTQSSSAFFDPSDTLLTTDSSAITSTEFYASPASISLPDFTIRKSNVLANRAAVYGLESPTDNGSRDRKRMRTSSSCSSSRGGSVGVNNVHSSPAIGSLPSSVEVSSAMPMVMVDTQEVGVRLVHALMACAEAVQEENYKAADILVKQISMLASSQGGAMRKVAGYFAEALARRIYRVVPQDCSLSLDSTFSDILQMHFYESCPYLKFAHFTANQAILEAFAGCRRVHVIDFSMKQGMQWPALMQALALRPGGPPSFRLTGIGPPQLDNTDALQQVGWKLAQLAETIHVDFEYRGFVANNLADLEPYMLESLSPVHNSSGEPEVVAINSIFELHRLLAWPGALEKVLSTVRAVKPRIVTVVEQEASHNTGPFMERFTEALHYYSTMFDSLESGDITGDGQHDLMMSEVYLGRQICNVISAEGSERTERHETLTQWRARMGGAGFEPVHLGSNAFKQASMLLALFSGGEGYRVEEKEGCLTLGWHTRPLIATSAWRVVGPADSLSANASSDSRQSSSAPTLVLPSS